MTIILLSICLIGTIVLLVVGLKSSKQDQKVDERLSTLNKTPADTKNNRVIRKKAMEASFNERVLFPMAQKIFDKTQQIIPLSSKSWVKAKLVQAGYQKAHYPKIFLGIQLLTTIMLFGTLFTLTSLFGSKFGGLTGIIISCVFGLIGYALPMLWLLQQASRRQESIQKSLADFLDLLVICVEAGLGLDTAINKISNLKSVRTSHYLRDELQIYTKDVAFGKPRKDALLALAERTGVDDLNSIINAIVQSYEMGTGVAHTLRIQSDSLRIKRLAKAEEKANKIPVKMVMPIYIFLFPAIFVCIFGPIGMIMIDAVMKIMGGIGTVGGN